LVLTKNARLVSSRQYPHKSIYSEHFCKGLDERRERKRVKRDIVKPGTNTTVHISPPASERGNKKVARKRGKHHLGTASLALLHGFSATNVGKNRLTVSITGLLYLMPSRSHHDHT
jgi:hypothetical protein